MSRLLDWCVPDKAIRAIGRTEVRAHEPLDRVFYAHRHGLLAWYIDQVRGDR